MTQCVGYDFTLKHEGGPRHWEELGAWLNGWCKKWVFQLEKGDTGYVHWQGRISLIKKKRMDEVLSQMRHAEWPFRWSITSTEVHKGMSFNYVMKEDSRVDGPWKDSDWEEPPRVTWQLQVFMDKHEKNMLGWQEWLKGYLEGPREMRKVICIVDEHGHTGKSLFSEFLEYEKLAYEVPPFMNSEDLMQCVCCLKEQKAYLIDMPRAMKKEKLCGFFAGIESLKDGKAYDKRYNFKKKRLNRPKVVIFTNKCPDVTLLSADRWDIKHVDQFGNLWIPGGVAGASL